MKTRVFSILAVLALGTVISVGVALPRRFLPLPEPHKASELVYEEFMGKYRKEVKTSFVRDDDGDIEIDMTPRTLGTFLDRLDKWDMSDAQMRDLYRWHHQYAPTDRVEEEMHNVRVRGWLKAIKYEEYDESGGDAEGDNDFHIILSKYRYANSKERFLNVEISGLPEDDGEDRETIRESRAQIAEILGDVNLPAGRYYKPTPPIRVEIEGSLYFDGSHYPGGVGPAGMRPKTVWEIHPVSSIEEVE